VDDLIYRELCLGAVRPQSKIDCMEIIEGLRNVGADGVIFGCTEITLLIGQADLDLPVFDTTAIHAESGIDFMVPAS
jgi:aspartate racemase